MEQRVSISISDGIADVRLVRADKMNALDAAMFVQGTEVERIGRAARPEVLAEIARVTRGQVIEPARLKNVIQSLAALPEPPPDIRRLQLWSHPATVAVMVVLLGLFWTARKVIGLI